MDTEAAAVWGAAQQVSGRFLCSQGLEDREAKAPVRPQGREAETPGQVIGPGTCQSIRGWGQGASSPGSGLERGAVLVGGPNALWESLPPHPDFPCLPGVPGGLCDSKMLRACLNVVCDCT